MILVNQTLEIPTDFLSFDQTRDTPNIGLSINQRYRMGYLEIVKNYISEVDHLKEAVQLKYRQKYSCRDKQRYTFKIILFSFEKYQAAYNKRLTGQCFH